MLRLASLAKLPVIVTVRSVESVGDGDREYRREEVAARTNRHLAGNGCEHEQLLELAAHCRLVK